MTHVELTAPGSSSCSFHVDCKWLIVDSKQKTKPTRPRRLTEDWSENKMIISSDYQDTVFCGCTKKRHGGRRPDGLKSCSNRTIWLSTNKNLHHQQNHVKDALITKNVDLHIILCKGILPADYTLQKFENLFWKSQTTTSVTGQKFVSFFKAQTFTLFNCRSSVSPLFLEGY